MLITQKSGVLVPLWLPGAGTILKSGINFEDSLKVIASYWVVWLAQLYRTFSKCFI